MGRSIVGGSGPKRTPRLAARFADEYNAPFRRGAVVAELNARVDEACRAVGRAPESLLRSATVVVVCGRTDAEIERRAARTLGIAPPGQHAMKVTPDGLVELIAEYEAVGTQRIYLRVFDLADLDHLEAISSAVVGPVPIA